MPASRRLLALCLTLSLSVALLCGCGSSSGAPSAPAPDPTPSVDPSELYSQAEACRKAMDYSAAIPLYTQLLDLPSDLTAKAYLGRYRSYAGRGMYGDGRPVYSQHPAVPETRPQDFAAALADLDAACALDASLAEKYLPARSALQNTETGLFLAEDGMQWDVWAHETYYLSYDKNNNLLFIIETLYSNPKDRYCCTSYDPQGTLISTIPEIFDAAGNRIRGMYSWTESGEMSAADWEYNAANELVALIHGSTRKEFETLQTDEGRQEITRRYDSGTLSSTTTDYFDLDGNQTLKVTVTPNGATETTEYIRDDSGRLLRRNEPNGGWIEYQYDADGTTTYFEYSSNGTLKKSGTNYPKS